MRQKLGQHFLKNPAVAAAAAVALEPTRDDRVIEVGPGHGELTQAIVAAYGKIAPEFNMIAVERDPVLAAELKRRFAALPAVTVIEGDIMQELSSLVAKLPQGPYKVAGNIPYYLTGHLLRALGDLERKPERIVMLVQKEVAERLTAAPPKMNKLAAMVQFWAEVDIIRAVKRTDFRPPPEVDSAVIRLSSKAIRGKELAAAFYKTARILFAQPRKTTFNNLKEGLKDKKDAPEVARVILADCGIDAGVRPQDLGVADIERIARLVEEKA